MSRSRSHFVPGIALAVLALAFALPAGAQVSPGAEQIYDRARAAVIALPMPAYLAYTADFTFDRKGKIETAHERILLRAGDGHALVQRLPDSPSDKVDSTPHVITQGAKDDPAAALPLTTFGLRPKKASSEFLESTDTPAPEPSGTDKVIASVQAVDRPYDLTFAGDEDVNGRPCYHLTLVPRRDPEHHRIRELYVDRETFVPQRYVIAVTAAAGPIKKTFYVTCDASVVDGYTLLTRAQASFVLRALFFSYGGTGHYAVRDVSFPQRLPDWLFDPDAFSRHKGEPIAELSS